MSPPERSNIMKRLDCLKLRSARRQSHLRLSDVSARIGVNKSTVWRYENGLTGRVPIDVIMQLVELYGITIDEVLI